MINTISSAVNSACFIGTHLDNEDSISLAVLCCISPRRWNDGVVVVCLGNGPRYASSSSSPSNGGKRRGGSGGMERVIDLFHGETDYYNETNCFFGSVNILCLVLSRTNIYRFSHLSLFLLLFLIEVDARDKFLLRESFLYIVIYPSTYCLLFKFIDE